MNYLDEEVSLKFEPNLSNFQNFNNIIVNHKKTKSASFFTVNGRSIKKDEYDTPGAIPLAFDPMINVKQNSLVVFNK